MNTLTKLRKDLEAAQRTVESQLAKLHKAEETALLSLPEKVGLKTVDELIEALAPYRSQKTKGQVVAPAKAKAVKATVPAPANAAKAKPAKKSKKRTRATITSEIKDQVEAAVKAGKTGATIARELGISLPSVGNIKRERGLTKKS